MLLTGAGSLTYHQDIDNILRLHLGRFSHHCGFLRGFRHVGVFGLRRAAFIIHWLRIGVSILGQCDNIHLLELALNIPVHHARGNEYQRQNHGKYNQQNFQSLLFGLLLLLKTSMIAHA